MISFGPGRLGWGMLGSFSRDWPAWRRVRIFVAQPAGRDGLRLESGERLLTDFEAGADGDAAVLTGSGTCSGVRVASELSLTGGLVGAGDLGTLLGKMVVSLRINVPRMGFTSDNTGWRHG